MYCSASCHQCTGQCHIIGIPVSVTSVVYGQCHVTGILYLVYWSVSNFHDSVVGNNVDDARAMFAESNITKRIVSEDDFGRAAKIVSDTHTHDLCL